jgi:hypothetical protein
MIVAVEKRGGGAIGRERGDEYEGKDCDLGVGSGNGSRRSGESGSLGVNSWK